MFFWIASDFSIDLLQCTSELQTPITFLFVNENMKCGVCIFLVRNMRNILVPKLFGFAKNFRFSSFASSTSVHLYCLFNVTSSKSYDVTCQSYDVESFKTSFMNLTK